MSFRADARGEGLIASNACSGPVPLPLSGLVGWLRGLRDSRVGCSFWVGCWAEVYRTDAVVGTCLGEGSAGSVLRAQVSSGENELSRCARGEGLIASNACSSPVPLPLRLRGPTD